MGMQCTKLRHFSACNFNHVRSPTGFSQRLPIESAKYLCLRVILRWLISLAASALLGRCIGQDVLRPQPPAYALAASWLCAGIRLAWTQAPLCCAFIWKEVPRDSKKCHVLCESLQPGRLRGQLEGHQLCCMAKSPASCFMLKLFGNLEWYCISPGSSEAVTTALMNLSQSFNNAAIYRLSLYWIDCRSCTKAHSVSAVKL